MILFLYISYCVYSVLGNSFRAPIDMLCKLPKGSTTLKVFPSRFLLLNKGVDLSTSPKLIDCDYLQDCSITGRRTRCHVMMPISCIVLSPRSNVFPDVSERNGREKATLTNISGLGTKQVTSLVYRWRVDPSLKITWHYQKSPHSP